MGGGGTEKSPNFSSHKLKIANKLRMVLKKFSLTSEFQNINRDLEKRLSRTTKNILKPDFFTKLNHGKRRRGDSLVEQKRFLRKVHGAEKKPLEVKLRPWTDSNPPSPAWEALNLTTTPSGRTLARKSVRKGNHSV